MFIYYFCQIMLFLIQRPCVVNKSAESADHKFNCMDSVLVDRKCGDYVMSPSDHRYMAYLKPDQHDPFLTQYLGQQKQPL